MKALWSREARLRRYRRWTRSDRGAVAVEAALVTPVLLLMVFGIIEFSLLMRDNSALSYATRAGARVASSQAMSGPVMCGSTACSPAQPALARAAVDAIQRAGLAMPLDSINYVMVYKANLQGYPGSDGNTTMPTTCASTANCVLYTWSSSSNSFVYSNGSWTSSTISACFPGSTSKPLDRVGVQIAASHKMVTGMFGTTKGIGDHAVMNFEPAPPISCGSGDHT